MAKKDSVSSTVEGFDTAVRLTKKDLRAAMENMDIEAIRLIVSAYYKSQDDRIRSGNRVSALEKSGVNTMLFSYLKEQSMSSEETIKRAMDVWVQQHPVANWCYEIDGIGPILAAGLVAMFRVNKPVYDEDVEDSIVGYERIETAGAWWKYAGIDVGGRKREKGKKTDYNPDAKRLCWILGECFVKVSGKETAYYGHLYKERKEQYTRKNEAGGFADRAKELLGTFSKTTESYKHLEKGMLPPAQIHAMARRYAVKIFLSHLHAEWYRYEFKQEPPAPFAIGILQHAHPLKHPYGRIVDLK